MAKSSSYSWSDLHPELLCSVFDCLNDVRDFIRSSAVCSSWRNSVACVYHRKFFPSLFVLHGCTDQDRGTIASLFRHLTFQDSGNLDFPEASENWVCGCTRGCLFTIGISFPYEVHLLNPFKKIIISLPPLTSFQFLHQLLQFQETFLVSEIPKNFVKKAVSSTDLSDPNCVVLIIYSFERKLAFCRPGDKSWTEFEPNKWTTSIDDVVFNNGVFFAVDRIGEVLYCELSTNNPKVTRLGGTTPFRHMPGKRYFAESILGQIWVVLKKLEYNDFADCTISFEIYELDLETKEWKRVRSLKGQALFLSSQGQSMAVLAANHGSEGFIKSNSVYFTDDFTVFDSGLGGLSNLSVFEWESKQIKKLYQPISWNSQLYWITQADMY